MYFSQSGMLSSIMSIISNCTARSAPATVKHRKFYIRVSFIFLFFFVRTVDSFEISYLGLIANKTLSIDEGNQALQEFLAARNPKQQHSSTLESYLIKPIQRILKYPLLLQQLRNLTDVNSEEHLHLVGECHCLNQGQFGS